MNNIILQGVKKQIKFIDEKDIVLDNLRKEDFMTEVYVVGEELKGAILRKKENSLMEKHFSEDGLTVKEVAKTPGSADEVYIDKFNIINGKRVLVLREHYHQLESTGDGVVSVDLNGGYRTECKYDCKGRLVECRSHEDGRDSYYTVGYIDEGDVTTSTYKDSLGRVTHVLKNKGDLIMYCKTISYAEDASGNITEIKYEYDSEDRMIRCERVSSYETSLEILMYTGDLCISRTVAIKKGECNPDKTFIIITNTKTNRCIYSNTIGVERVTVLDFDKDTGISTETIKMLRKTPDSKGSMEDIHEITKRNKSGKIIYRFIAGNEHNSDYEEFYEYDEEDKLVKVVYSPVGMRIYYKYDDMGRKIYEKVVNLAEDINELLFRVKEIFIEYRDDKMIENTIMYYDKKEA